MVDLAPGVPSYSDSTTLDLNPPQQGSLDLIPVKPVVTYGNDYSQTKANRYAVTLGPDSPGNDVINNAIVTGDQTRWQTLLKQNQDVDNMLARNSAIRSIAEKGNPTADDVAIVSQLSNSDLHSPDLDTILEKKYSDFFTDTVSSAQGNKIIAPALDENSDASLDVLNAGTDSQQRMMIAQDKLEAVSKQYDDSRWLGAKGWSFAAGFLPGWTWYQNRNRIEVPSGSPGLTTAANLKGQVAYLYTLPPDEFKRQVDQAVDSLAKTDIGQAQQFIQAINSYGSSSEAFQNLDDALNLTTILGVAKSAFTGAARLATGMKTASKAVLLNPEEISKASAQAGMNETAAVSNMAKSVSSGDLSGVATIKNAKDLEERLPSVITPSRAYQATDSSASAAINRVHQTAQRGSEDAAKILTSNEGVDVLEPSQVTARAQEAFDTVKDTFSSIQDHVQDMKIIPAEDNKLLNRPAIDVRIAERDGSDFSTIERAEQFAKKYIGIKTNDYTVEQNGVGGYYINIRKNLGADGDFRNVQIDTTLKAPDTVANRIFGGLRSPDYNLPQQNVEARGRMLHGSEYMGNKLKTMTEPFAKVGKDGKEALTKVFNDNRATKKYFRNPEEFDSGFRSLNGRAPTVDETDAYFRWKEFNDLDYHVRDADYVKQMVDRGGEKFSFKLQGDDGKPSSKEFNGVEVKQLPWDSPDDFRLTAIEKGTTKFDTNSRYLSGKLEEIEDMIKNQGYKILSEEGNSRYYLVKDFKRDNIKLGQLSYKEGGHNDPAYDHFIKQGDFSSDSRGVKYYNGDKALFMAPTRKDSEEVAALFEQARQMYKAHNPRAAAFIEDHLPIGWNEWVKKVKTGQIDIDAPIMAVRKGERTNALRDYSRDFSLYSESIDSTHNPFAGVGGRYLQQKGEVPIDIFKSEGNTAVKFDADPYLNPWDTLKNATADMLDLKLTRDYMTKSALDYFQEFSHLLDTDKNKMLSNPMKYLTEPSFKAGADPGQVKIAKQVASSISSFLYHRSPEEEGMQVWKEKLLDTIFNKFGDDGLLGRKAFDDKYLWTVKDAQGFMRRATFNMKLGFFNPKSLFLQAAQGANIIAIAPKEGLQAARAYPLLRLALMSDEPEVLNGMFNKLGKLAGWDKKDFMDMLDSFKSSGFATVGSDIGLLDDIRPVTTATSNPLKKAWSYNTSFYNEGERISRSLSYATAWREMKNAGIDMDRFGRTKVLQRAKDLNGNMTRDSNSAWQRGYLGLATQFMGYQARFMEALWDGGLGNGRKFTQAEKTRLLVGMSTLYGVPIIGSAVTGYDWRAQIKQWMADTGKTSKDNPVVSAFVDGLAPSLVNAMLGTDFDISSSYGPNGIPTFADMFTGDKSWAQLMGGAAGGQFATLLGSVYPAAQGLFDALSNPGKDSTFPVLIEDLLEPLKSVSTVNSVNKVWEAINTNKWLTNSGYYATNTTVPEAIASAIFGINPLRVSEAYDQATAIKKTKEGVSEAQKEVQSWTEKSIAATKRGDPTSASVYISRAHSAAIKNNLSYSEEIQAKQRAFDSNPFDESVEHSYEQQVIQRRQRGAAMRQLQGQ